MTKTLGIKYRFLLFAFGLECTHVSAKEYYSLTANSVMFFTLREHPLSVVEGYVFACRRKIIATRRAIETLEAELKTLEGEGRKESYLIGIRLQIIDESAGSGN